MTKKVPKCPDFIGSYGQIEYKRITSKLDNIDIHNDAYYSLLVMYCEAWNEFVELTIQMKDMGAIVMTANGNPVQNPVLGAKNRAAERMLKVAAQFGMTPQARRKLDIVENNKSELEAFIGA